MARIFHFKYELPHNGPPLYALVENAFMSLDLYTVLHFDTKHTILPYV